MNFSQIAQTLSLSQISSPIRTTIEDQLKNEADFQPDSIWFRFDHDASEEEINDFFDQLKPIKLSKTTTVMEWLLARSPSITGATNGYQHRRNDGSFRDPEKPFFNFVPEVMDNPYLKLSEDYMAKLKQSLPSNLEIQRLLYGLWPETKDEV